MKVCLFDIDGTLLLTAGAGKRAFAQAFDREFNVTELGPEISFAGRSDRGIVTELFAYHGVKNNEENWERFRRSYVEFLGDNLPSYGGELLPGCLQLIERLEATGDVHLGLLTGNVRDGAKRKLTHFGVWDRFAFGGFGDRHADRNGIADEARQRAREHHGSRADGERIVVIGDTPNDVRCARSIGAYAVGVATGPTSEEDLAASEPDLLLSTLVEHEAILEWLEG